MEPGQGVSELRAASLLPGHLSTVGTGSGLSLCCRVRDPRGPGPCASISTTHHRCSAHSRVNGRRLDIVQPALSPWHGGPVPVLQLCQKRLHLMTPHDFPEAIPHENSLQGLLISASLSTVMENSKCPSPQPNKLGLGFHHTAKSDFTYTSGGTTGRIRPKEPWPSSLE